MQVLYDKYKSRGFVVLGFPCNQFANEEPDDEAKIKRKIQSMYNVEFPMFAKVDVNGNNTHPVYKYLKSFDGVGTDDLEWNFVKYLVGKDGKPFKRYPEASNPMVCEPDIVALLG